MQLRVFAVFLILLATVLAILGVLGVFTWDELSDKGGRLVVVLFVIFAATAAITVLGPKNEKSESDSRRQGPNF